MKYINSFENGYTDIVTGDKFSPEFMQKFENFHETSNLSYIVNYIDVKEENGINIINRFIREYDSDNYDDLKFEDDFHYEDISELMKVCQSKSTTLSKHAIISREIVDYYNMFVNDKSIISDYQRLYENVVLFAKDTIENIVKSLCNANHRFISLTGDWGSGKSTVVYGVKDEIENGDEYVADYVYIFKVDEYLWSYTNEFEIIYNLFSEYIHENSLEVVEYKGRKETFEKLMSIDSRTNVLMEMLYSIKRKFTSESKRIRDMYDNSTRDTTEKALEIIKEMLESNEHRIVFMIDELDRIDPMKSLELLNLFLYINNRINSENDTRIQFILSYNYDVLSSALASRYGFNNDDSFNFIDKYSNTKYTVFAKDSEEIFDNALRYNFDTSCYIEEDSVSITHDYVKNQGHGNNEFYKLATIIYNGKIITGTGNEKYLNHAINNLIRFYFPYTLLYKNENFLNQFKGLSVRGVYKFARECHVSFLYAHNSGYLRKLDINVLLLAVYIKTFYGELYKKIINALVRYRYIKFNSLDISESVRVEIGDINNVDEFFNLPFNDGRLAFSDDEIIVVNLIKEISYINSNGQNSSNVIFYERGVERESYCFNYFLVQLNTYHQRSDILND